MRKTRKHPVVIVLVACLVAVLGMAAAAQAMAGPTPASVARPTITLLGADSEIPGTVFVSGVGFTPGGKVNVSVVVLDPSGYQVQQITEVTASRTRSVVSHYTGDGRPAGDPTYNTPGGMFLVTLEHVCGAQATVRAYDRNADAWSNWLTFTPDCSNSDGL